MKKFISITCIWQLIMLAMISIPANRAYSTPVKQQDSSLTVEIHRQLKESMVVSDLRYPASVNRFYNQENFQPVWIKPQTAEGQTWQAMLLLDCVLQYGLVHDDYHPKELLYDKLHYILDIPGKVSVKEQAQFEITLTDAMITLMNNLHYGKLNPEFSSAKIDADGKAGFRAEANLLTATQQKKGYDFMRAIESVQPKSTEYKDMQYHMRLLTGLYTGDCYEIPESDIRKIAINMERLRWADIEDGIYIQVNIPSYAMQFYQPDTTYEFKVAVGKPVNPTPAFNSTISYITTAPDVKMLKIVFNDQIIPNALNDLNYLQDNHFAIYNNKGEFVQVNKFTLAQIAQNPNKYYARHASGCDKGLGNIVFHCPNKFNIDLHDMPKQDFFNQGVRDLSNGCIWVDNAEMLAGLLLKNDSRQNDLKTLHKAIVKYKRKIFMLNKQVPVKVTYLTCVVKEGRVINYKDIYNLDNSLEMALYNTTQQLVNR